MLAFLLQIAPFAAFGGGAAALVASFFLPAPLRLILKPVLWGVAAIAMLGGIWLSGRASCAEAARLAEKIAVLEAEKAALAFDLRTARELADLAFRQTEAEQAATLDAQKKVELYAAYLANHPIGPCSLGPDDVDRLLGIHP